LRRQTTVEVEALQAELIQLNVTKITEAKTQQIIDIRRHNNPLITNPESENSERKIIQRNSTPKSILASKNNPVKDLSSPNANQPQYMNVVASYENNIGNNRTVITTVLKPISAGSATTTTDTSYSS